MKSTNKKRKKWNQQIFNIIRVTYINFQPGKKKKKKKKKKMAHSRARTFDPRITSQTPYQLS